MCPSVPRPERPETRDDAAGCGPQRGSTQLDALGVVHPGEEHCHASGKRLKEVKTRHLCGRRDVYQQPTAFSRVPDKFLKIGTTRYDSLNVNTQIIGLQSRRVLHSAAAWIPPVILECRSVAPPSLRLLLRRDTFQAPARPAGQPTRYGGYA
jgi:hypothetical protein